MRLLSVAVLALACSGSSAAAQTTVRYFNGVYGLLGDIETDAFLKETRQGGKVVSAELDLCHAPSPGSPLRDRFVVTLKPQGNRLIGSGQTQEGRLPVAVDLVRSATGNSYSFEGTVKLGDRILKSSSDDLADMSAKEFEEQTAVEEAIVETPADFREVTPGTLGIRVARTGLIDFLKALRAENVKVQGYSIAPSCEALRRGTVDVQVDVDPERAAETIAKAKALPGSLVPDGQAAASTSDARSAFRPGDSVMPPESSTATNSARRSPRPRPRCCPPNPATSNGMT
ncbi:MAG: hypothetical protein AB7V13_02390 [Pseudorhodoplanes sp.]|uniref:hypothetical protein n=1 Tax=Pseudorhodoplanes sp. TaxID=1934341 RepID=UPI003D13C4A1